MRLFVHWCSEEKTDVLAVARVSSHLPAPLTIEHPVLLEEVILEMLALLFGLKFEAVASWLPYCQRFHKFEDAQGPFSSQTVCVREWEWRNYEPDGGDVALPSQPPDISHCSEGAFRADKFDHSHQQDVTIWRYSCMNYDRKINCFADRFLQFITFTYYVFFWVFLN